MAINLLRNLSQLFRRTKSEENLEEGIKDEKRELLKLEMEDEDLVKEIEKDIEQAKPLYQQMKDIAQENEDYYLAQQLDRSRFEYELPTAENYLYMATESITAIITSKRRDPIAISAQDTDESRELAYRSQQFLTWKWSEQDMNIKFEDWVRQVMLSRIGVFKVRYDPVCDDFEIKVLRSQRILIDPDATDEDDAKFIVEYKKDKAADLVTMFPKKEKEIQEFCDNKMGTKLTYVEYWTNEFTAWKLDKILLDSKKNPNWNWPSKTEGKETQEGLKAQIEKQTKGKGKLKNVLKNFFKKPRKPYIIVNLKSLGRSIYSDTGDFDQCVVLQDFMNRRKRQIDSHSIHSRGRLVATGDVITKQEFKKVIQSPNAPIWFESGEPSKGIQWIGPQAMTNTPADDLAKTLLAFDNVFGLHGTVRGERGPQETATGRTILREGDLGRIDLSVRRIDKKLELLYGWMMQMAKVYYTKDHWIKILGKEGAIDYIDFSQEDIEEGMEIMVKSELTADKATQREEVSNMFKGGMVDPLTLFEKFDMHNPKELSRKLVLFKMDPKVYMSEYCVDENTPGMEDDPQMQARRENKKLSNGEKVPPFQNPTVPHIREHNREMSKDSFKQRSAAEKANWTDHINAELEILKAEAEKMRTEVGGGDRRPPQGTPPQGEGGGAPSGPTPQGGPQGTPPPGQAGGQAGTTPPTPRM